MIFERFDVVVVPLPFTDREAEKRRPALVISDARHFNARTGHSVMAMITSASHAGWPLDVIIEDLDVAGLQVPSLVRMKLFTLDHRLIIRRAGHLSAGDAKSVQASLVRLIG